jgi:hypothetical protein
LAIVIPTLAWGGGIGAAIVIGALAGLLPAIRAARLSPTEALRNRLTEPRRAVGRQMELGGLEPPTSWVRSRRSPN